MGNVQALRTKDISPTIVAESIRKAIEDGQVDHIYVITIKDGRTTAYASGDLNMLGLAYVALGDLVRQYVKGEVESER